MVFPKCCRNVAFTVHVCVNLCKPSVHRGSDITVTYYFYIRSYALHHWVPRATCIEFCGIGCSRSHYYSLKQLEPRDEFSNCN